MKRKLRIYFRSFRITLVVIICLCFGLYGISVAYENTARIAFGENRKAFSVGENGVKILDFEISF